ncbi:MAG TPA: hypothetical protein VFL61_04120 [Gaiellaceae bacterium]|nr:hypothetical protein [Gaiellaceae bacterium]
MNGYELITAVDDKRWGTVVGQEDDYVVVEHGTLRKHRYAVPKASLAVDENAREVRTTLSGELIGESPTVDDGFDREAVARHYGLGDIGEAGVESTSGLPDESPALLGDRLSDVRDER